MTRPGEGLQIDDVVLLGRTYEEYAAYFDLGDGDLRGARVLDIGSGVGSFGAEARTRGYDVLGADPIYGVPADAIEPKCRDDLAEVVRQLPAIAHNYVWGGYYRDIADLERRRVAAYTRFLEDYRERPEGYVRASLPDTGFAAQQFTLTLVSHLLFLYDAHLDYELHKRSLLELVRVTSGEVRIYPLTNLRAEPSPFVQRFLEDGERPPLHITRRKVPFEFLKGAQEMMVIDTKRAPAS
jgi:SAM-dependent methyltransferase